MTTNPVTFDAERYQGRLAWGFGNQTASPFIGDTWMTVGRILGCLAGGWTRGDILWHYPRLTEDDIIFALIYAHDTRVIASYASPPQPPNIDDLNRVIGHPMAGKSHREQA